MNSLFTVPMNAMGSNYSTFYLFAFLVGSLIVLYEGYRRKWPLVSCFILVAWCSIWAIIGSKLIVIPLEEWKAALQQGILPVTTEKSFLGGALGGLLGVFLAQRLLRFRYPVSDAFAFALPIGLAIGRIGCLLGGCCFGIPTNLPWAITYPVNSHAYNTHLAKGLIGPDASTSLPIHPTQLYEIVFLLVIVAILLISRKRLKKPGSLFYLFIILYSSLRFLEEFVREGGSAASGLKPEQWGLLLVFLSVSILLIRREWHLDVRLKPIQSTQEKLHRNAIATLAVAPFLFISRDWFTPLEMTTLIILALPAFIGITIQITRCLSKKYLRWAEITILVTSILFINTNFDTSTPNDESKTRSFNLSLAGMLGEYVETCGGSHYYEILGAGISYTEKFSQLERLELGVKGYFGSDHNGGSYQILGINPYLQTDLHWIGFGIGGHFGDLYLDGDPTKSFLQASVRIGPYDKFFVEARLGDHYPGSIPAPMMKIGIGFGFKNGASFRLGLSDAGYYINPYIPLKSGAAISPFIAFGDENTYQFGLTLKFRLGKQ